MADATTPAVTEPAHARAGPDAPARIRGVGLSHPDGSLTQPEMLELLGLSGDDFAEGVFARCGVRKRHVEATPDLLSATLQQRTARTEDQLLGLAERAIDELEVDPDEVGVVVTGSYYSLGGPTLAHRLVESRGLDPGTDKYHVTGVGCASAVPLVRLATQALRERPGRRALVVAAESVTGFLTGAAPDDARAKVVGSALFGDGCAAALLALDGDGGGPAILETAVHQVPGTLDHVRFDVTGADSHMRIARELPAIAETELRPLVDGFLERRGLDAAAVDHWLVHPGGRGILEGVRRGLGLDERHVAPSAWVLSEFGNVGTPSALFVLRATVEQRRPEPGDRGLMVTIGPGVTVGLMLLQW